jgi:maltose-binding protein MalE
VLAQTFLTEFLATEENYQAIYDAEARPSAWKSIFEAATGEDTIGFNEAGVNADPMPSIPAMGFVWDAWTGAGNLTLSGELSAADALTAAEELVLSQVKK